VQNYRGEDVENHYHQNHSDSPASEPLIEHTDDEFKVKLTNTNIYNNYGDLVKVYRDVIIEHHGRIIYIFEGCGRLGKKGLWFEGNGVGHKIYCRPVYMRGRLEIANDVIYACSQQLQGNRKDRWQSLKQSGVGNSL